jgi:hypothetical protein
MSHMGPVASRDTIVPQLSAIIPMDSEGKSVEIVVSSLSTAHRVPRDSGDAAPAHRGEEGGSFP